MPLRRYEVIYSPEELKRTFEDCGSHFFEPQTMRSFGSRLLDEIIDLGEEVLFVTSERRPGGNRRYTVRVFEKEKCGTTKVGEFQQYTTAAQAKGALKREVARRRALAERERYMRRFII